VPKFHPILVQKKILIKNTGNQIKMPYYPVYVDLSGKWILIIGGGRVAKRKIETLLEFGANIKIIAKDILPDIQRYIDKGVIRLSGLQFHESALNDVFMVIAATDDKALNSRIGRIAKSKGLLVNVVDQPEDCSFFVPSIIKRGDLVIAISTSGKSPAMAKAIREKLEGEFGSEHAIFLDLMGNLRKMILNMGLSQEENMSIFNKLVNSDLFDAICVYDTDRAINIINEITGISKDRLRRLLSDTQYGKAGE
jgi:precorrin-2 dehydrogenase/sirohydrochlorin ferrochelatase